MLAEIKVEVFELDKKLYSNFKCDCCNKRPATKGLKLFNHIVFVCDECFNGNVKLRIVEG